MATNIKTPRMELVRVRQAKAKARAMAKAKAKAKGTVRAEARAKERAKGKGGDKDEVMGQVEYHHNLDTGKIDIHAACSPMAQ